jgi:hypothetical protein
MVCVIVIVDQLDGLLRFINERIHPYGLPPITNVTSNMQDGKVLQALADSLERGIIDMTPVCTRCYQC